MCGIVGFNGAQQAAPILLEGLSRLEYRGYDSAGLAVRNGMEPVEVVKAKGRLRELYEKTDAGHAMPGACGIGHTRWATHGVPNNLNAHPHTNSENTISLVHNGIIENYLSLKQLLENNGYSFQSETDSEAVVHLIDYYFHRCNDLGDAFRKAVRDLEGSYALCVVSTYSPDTIYVARKESPMILGISEDGTFCASDAPALLEYTRKLISLQDGDTAVLKPDSVRVYDLNDREKPLEWLSFP